MVSSSLRLCRRTPDDLVRLVGDGADVDVLPVALFLKQLDGDAGEVVGGVGEAHQEHAGGGEESLVVLTGPEDEELLLFLVPVGPYPFEDAGAVVEGVGAHADHRLLDGHDATFEERIAAAHGLPPLERW
jgi:hypothetical protein